MREQVGDVPVQAVRLFDRAVRETAHWGEPQFVVTDVPQHDSTARRAEVDRGGRVRHATVPSSKEGGGDAGVDGDVQPGGVAEVARAEHEHRVGHVLGKYFALEQGALGVVLAEVLLVDAVHGGALGLLC